MHKYDMESLSFTNSRQQKISAVLEPGKNKDALCVVMCHGLPASKNSSRLVMQSEALSQHGIASLRFDFTGHGESEGEFFNVTITNAVQDAQAAIAAVRELGYTRVALLGASFGGFIALLTAAQDPSLIALGLKSPVADFTELTHYEYSPEILALWKNQGYLGMPLSEGGELQLGYTFYTDMLQYHGYEIAQGVKMPTCIVHSGEDEQVPLFQGEKLAQTIRNSEFHVVAGANHRYTDENHAKEMIALFTDFFVRWNER